MTAITCSCGIKVRADRQVCPRCRAALVPAQPRVPAAESAGSSKALPIALGVMVLFAGGLWIHSALRDEPVTQVSAPPRDPLASRRAAAAPPAQPAATAPAAAPSAEATSAGAASYVSGDYATALDRYKAAIDKNPQDAEALSNYGQVLVRMGKVEDAIPYFDRAIALVPQRWAYHFNRARALGLLGRMDEAVKGYREAQRAVPERYATAFNLGLALHRTGDEQGAVRPTRRRSLSTRTTQRSTWRSGQASNACSVPATPRRLRAVPRARPVCPRRRTGPRPHRTAHAGRCTADAARFLRRAVSAFTSPARRRTFLRRDACLTLAPLRVFNNLTKARSAERPLQRLVRMRTRSRDSCGFTLSRCWSRFL